MGYYLYAVIAASDRVPTGLTGLNGAPVFPLVEGNLAAVVSDISERRLRPERRLLTAHQGVLRQLLESTTPLPVSFGIVSDDETSSRLLLKNYKEDLQEQLARVGGAVEMGLRVRWDVENIFDFLLSRNPELTELRDQIRDNEASSGPQHQSRIELGRMFERILEAEREQVDDQVSAVLGRACREIHRSRPRTENDILNLACLVDRARQEEFASRIVEAASGFDVNFAFDYNGPWAPHNFVRLNLEEVAQ